MSRRTEKVASIVREVVGEAIAGRLSDPRISRFTSVTRVEVSGDVMHATVYVSVMGKETDERKTLAGLEHARGYLQSLLAAELTTRHCPQLRFVADRGLKKQMEILERLDKISAELHGADADQRTVRNGESLAGANDQTGNQDEPDDSDASAGDRP